METLQQVIAMILLVLGTFLSLVGVIGFIRLPDVYTRLHATGKVSVFGLVFLLLAVSILTPLTAWKGILLIFFVLLASPAVSHSIASAAYKAGVPLAGPKRDDLKSKLERGSDKDV
ncbi:MAG: monovalent cation/H(+) antiporter subunit G [Anaerolineales bacterium]|nr:monovalent cation/H(+) antiporter subunit G [Anaerolineales bacterium]